MWEIFVKNGMYIHFLHALLQYRYGTFVASAVGIKMYSINYFYWYGHMYSYLANRKYNWVKQFIRFTDTGHIASFLIIICPEAVPISHNVQFLIMTGYWAGKLVFNMKDADRIPQDKDNHLVDAHTDFCTYIHHTIPYAVVILKMAEIGAIKDENYCAATYDNVNLIHTYLWVYTWLVCIYMPWRLYTNDTVYSILDINQTSLRTIGIFIGVFHLLIFVSNCVGHIICKSIV